MSIKKVIKRDGRVADFNKGNIERAIIKAAKASNSDINIDEITEYIIDYLEHNFKDNIPKVEGIQDIVEKALVHFDHPEVAKAFILYRQKHANEREGKYLIDVLNLVDGYINQHDWRIKENANTSYSVSGLMFHISGAVAANYSLNKYPESIGNMHRRGDIHIHDLSLGLITHYCSGLDLEKLIFLGIKGIPGKISSRPAKHLSSICSHMLNFLGCCQLEAAGAQAYSSVDTLLAPFVKQDKLTYEQVKQNIQSLFFNLNVPSRWSMQAPFSNFTLDWTLPDDKIDDVPFIGGKPTDFTYSDCIEEMGMLNRAMMEVMTEGDAYGAPFTFPIITFNIDKDFDWNGPNTDYLFEATAKYGPFYFANFINTNLKKSDVRSMCCRLNLDLKLLRNKMGGVFGSGAATGSVGVVTINLPRLGYLHKKEKEFIDNLDYSLDHAMKSLEIKRSTITHNLKNGLMPFTKEYLGRYDTYFSTIGIIGMNECLLNMMGCGIWNNDARKFGLDIMDHIRSRLIEFQEKTGNLYNLEATPAEGTTRRLASLDKRYHPEIIVANEENWRSKKAPPFYSNSIHLPVGYTNDLFESLDLEEEFLTKFTGGCVKHIYLGQRLPTTDSARNLVRKVCTNYKVPYISITPSFSVCPQHGYINGVHEKCPKEI